MTRHLTRLLKPRLAAVGGSLPAAFLMWRFGQRLRARRTRTQTWRWVGAGLALAGVAGLAATLAVRANGSTSSRHQALDGRLEDELEASFPASDPPTVTRAGSSAEEVSHG